MFDAKLEKILQSSENTEGRRPEVISDDSGAQLLGHPTSTEVRAEKAKRRNLTVAYKVRVIETLKTLRSEGGSTIGAYLRKEGLYYSTVRKWEKQYERGALSGAHAKGPGKNIAALQAENKKLQRKLESAEKKLEKAKFILSFQKKISLMLEIDQPTYDDETFEIKSQNTEKNTV